jgi:hypothetical protein
MNFETSRLFGGTIKQLSPKFPISRYHSLVAFVISVLVAFLITIIPSGKEKCIGKSGEFEASCALRESEFGIIFLMVLLTNLSLMLVGHIITGLSKRSDVVNSSMVYLLILLVCACPVMYLGIEYERGETGHAGLVWLRMLSCFVPLLPFLQIFIGSVSATRQMTFTSPNLLALTHQAPMKWDNWNRIPEGILIYFKILLRRDDPKQARIR